MRFFCNLGNCKNLQKFGVFRGIKRAGVTKIAFFCVFFGKIPDISEISKISTFSKKWDSPLLGEKHRNSRKCQKNSLFFLFSSDITLADEIDAAVKSGVFRCFFVCKHAYPVSPRNSQKTESRLKIYKKNNDTRFRVDGRN